MRFAPRGWPRLLVRAAWLAVPAVVSTTVSTPSALSALPVPGAAPALAASPRPSAPPTPIAAHPLALDTARRVVDVVVAGDARSEAMHEYAGQDVMAGTLDGRPWRATRSWFGYTLRIFDDDTEVTIACTARGERGRRIAFDVLVDGTVIASPTVASPAATPVDWAWAVPRRLTAGKDSITITFRAGPDGSTPAILRVQTVQEHLE